ncbi:hypothetical protein [uncultured Veillonella sp.]|uniref:hypothetical protein n=1 Tax=uncultured Veillonella sp. TaxID=159268 RepID=UPI0025E8E477|nr:hypothetical protein [uncultured Veillonella sp.]MDY3974743.1 hypothetical protein [Veillonella caviae]
MNRYGKLALRITLGGMIYALYGLFSMVLGIYVAEEASHEITQHAAIALCLIFGGYLARKVYVKELSQHMEFHKYTLYFFMLVLLIFWGLAEGMLAYHSLSFTSFMNIVLSETNYFGLSPVVYYIIVAILLCIISAYFFVAFLCAAFSEWFAITIKESRAQYKAIREAVKASKDDVLKDKVDAFGDKADVHKGKVDSSKDKSDVFKDKT